MTKLFAIATATALAILSATAVTASAETRTCDPKTLRTQDGLVCFKDGGGRFWMVTKGNGVDMSSIHLAPNAELACPMLQIELEARKTPPKGITVTQEQKNRGDLWWHYKCDRSTLPPLAPTTASAPPTTSPPPAQQQSAAPVERPAAPASRRPYWMNEDGSTNVNLVRPL